MSRNLALALVPCAALTLAATDVGGGRSMVSAAFGNTIVSTYPDGRKAEIWLSPDGTYRGEGRRHDQSSGRWSVRGSRICFDQTQPARLFHHFCTTMPRAVVGNSWRSRAPTGEATTVTIVHGHVGG